MTGATATSAGARAARESAIRIRRLRVERGRTIVLPDVDFEIAQAAHPGPDHAS
jgi:hypothetical protein